MKNFLLGLAIILFGLSIPKLWPTKEITAVSILRDVTDSSIAEPDSQSVAKLYDLTDTKWKGGAFRYSTISDLNLNQFSETHLDAAFMLFSNEFERDKQVQDFTNDIATILTRAKADSIGRAHTSAYKPIATELKRLSESFAQKKILIVYSDLMENDSDFSLYGKNTLELIDKNPESVKQEFAKQVPLPSLSGITVYLVFQPTSEIGDKQFSVMSHIYSEMLQEAGAQVYIVPNL